MSAGLTGERTLGEVTTEVWQRLEGLPLPEGYNLYDGGTLQALQESQGQGRALLALAVFLVLVVMAVQYESLRNPLVILVSVPFAAIGVALAIDTLGMPLSMPVWLGLIMLAGIVVNNAIVLVEYVEQARARGLPRDAAIVEAARLRLRPILMTTLTTVFGMLPLALGQGSEMLRPLAVTIVWGLGFSTLVTLVLIPCVYRLAHAGGEKGTSRVSRPSPLPSPGSGTRATGEAGGEGTGTFGFSPSAPLPSTGPGTRATGEAGGEGKTGMSPWETLTKDEQTRLRVEYGHYLDSLPPTCSLEEKNARFARWLADRGVLYGGTAGTF